MINLDTKFNKIQMIIFGISLIFLLNFIMILILVLTNDKNPLDIDTNILNTMVDIRGEKNGFIFYLFRIISEFGHVYLLILFAIILMIYTRLDIRFIVGLVGILAALGSNFILKEIIARPRPLEELRWEEETSYSFPSSHSIATGFMYSYLIYFFNTDTKMNNNLKIILSIMSLLIIPLVLFSRVILAVHYFTDVIAGCSLGFVISGISIICLNILVKKEILTYPIFNRIKDRRKD